MMSDVRRAVVWLLVLAAIVIAGDHLAAIVLRQVLLRSQFRYSRLYRGGNDADILILGDSRGVHSFYAPALEEMTGRRVLNLSYNSMTPPIAEALLMDYLERNRAPRLVIIEPTCVITSGALTSELRTYAGLSPRMAAMYATSHPAAARVARLFWLFPLNSEFFIQALHYIRRSDQDWIIRETIPPVLRERHFEWPLVPGAVNVETLVRMVGTLRARNIEVRLIMAPYAPNNVPKNAAGFAALLSRRTRQPVSNYTAAIEDFDLFGDTVHLNERGSRALIALLARDGALGMARPATRF